MENNKSELQKLYLIIVIIIVVFSPVYKIILSSNIINVSYNKGINNVVAYFIFLFMVVAVGFILIKCLIKKSIK